ncbi:MAG: helix-turn-helix transcriptional regulator [Gemmatimonadota bacterium]
MRTARPYIVALVRNKVDQRYADLVDDILQASESRVSVCSLSPGDEDTLQVYVTRAAFSTDPSAIIEARYSVDEDSLWVCFGDGHNASLPWKNLGLSGVSPPLSPKTAVVSKDHDSIQVLRQDGSVFDVDSVAVRTLVDKAARQSIQEASAHSDQELGHLLREWRKTQGKTQLEVSRISGLEQALISKLENGRHRPRFDTLRRYSEALGLTVAEILRPQAEDTNPA